MRSPLRLLFVFVLILLTYWLFSAVALNALEARVGAVAQLVPFAVFLCVSVVAQLKPAIFSLRWFSIAAVVVVFASSGLLIAGANQCPSALLAVATAALACAMFWIEVRATLMLVGLEPITGSFVLAIAYIVSHAFMIVTPHIERPGGLALIALVTLVLFASSQPAQKLLSVYGTMSPPYKLSSTNPFSFLSFNSGFFWLLLLVAVVFGYLCQSSVAFETDQFGFLSFAPLFVLAICFLVGKGTLFSDTLFKIAACFVVAALVFGLAFQGEGNTLAIRLSFSGSELYDLVFYWYVLSVVGAKNQTAVLPALCWGRSMLILGFILGNYAHAYAGWLSAADQHLSELPLCLIALLFLVYLTLMGDSFKFDESAHRVSSPYTGEGEPLRNQQSGLNQSDSNRNQYRTILSTRYRLTDREYDVYDLLRQGRDCDRIKERLFISRNTVRSHTRSIYMKLGVHSQQDLISFDQELGIEIERTQGQAKPDAPTRETPQETTRL